MATISNNPYHTPKDGEYTVQNIMVNTYTANNVVITDPIPNTTSALFTYTVNPAVPNGATYVPSSIFANVAFTGDPLTAISLNKAVSDMLESISILQSILKQKLNIVNCQINPSACSCH